MIGFSVFEQLTLEFGMFWTNQGILSVLTSGGPFSVVLDFSSVCFILSLCFGH